MAELYFSQSPHIRSSNRTDKIMLSVCLALMPSAIMGVIYFGLSAALTIIVSAIGACGAEIVYRLISGEKFKGIIKSFDYSSLVTGLILSLILPANYYLYIPFLSSIFAVIVVKMFFGGTGYNVVNPAAIGRIFAFISFTTILNTFVYPSFSAINEDLLTGATSLQSLLKGGSALSALDLFLGTGVAGCIGETCKAAIILGGIYLAVKKIIKIWLPLLALISCGAGAVIFSGFDFSVFLPSILSGGLIFGAFFMATDYVTNPKTTSGNVIFFVGFGFLTALLRRFTGYETTSFALLLMNILVPFIDRIPTRKPFGFVKAKKEAKK